MKKNDKNADTNIKDGKNKSFIPLDISLDVAKIRKKMKLSQRQFAAIYHINIETLRKWEQHQRVPGSISKAYLKCIQNDAELIKHLVNR